MFKRKIFKGKKKQEITKNTITNDIEYFIDYAKTDNGYFNCIHINKYPEEVKEFFLTSLKDVLFSIDIKQKDKNIINNASSSLNNADNIAFFQQRKSSEKKANDNIGDLEDIIDLLKNNKLLDTHIRIFNFAETLKQLKFKTNLIEDKLGKYELSSYYNELDNDLDSLFTPLSKQKKQYNKEILSCVMPYLYHINGVFLNDKNGLYLGDSITGSPFIFNPSYVDDIRKNYNMLFFGLMGTGKSTLQKKIININLIKNGKIRIFDSSGEFNSLCKYYNGIYYNLDGSDGIINPLEIIRSNNSIESYNNNISKMVNIYSAFSKESNDIELNKFSTLLDSFYKSLNITRENNYNVKVFPILSDFLEFLKEYKLNLDKDFTTENMYKKIEDIIDNIESMVISYGHIFNKESNFNIKNNKLVVFNMKSLNSIPPNVFSAIMFNINSVLFSEMLNNIDFEKEQSNKEDPLYYVNYDEAHRIFNNINEKGKYFYIHFLKEARKYKASMGFSFHRVSDIENLEEIFDLCQYKFIFQQDINVIDIIREKFNNVFSDTELSMITSLGKGKCILSITGFKNIPLYVNLGGKIEQSLIATGGK